MRRLLTIMLALTFAALGGVTAAGTEDAIKAIDDFIKTAGIDKSAEGWKTQLPKPELVTFKKGKTYFANMKTNQGDVKIKLLPEVAPMHVTSLIYLTRLGFYDDLTFHRVIPNFMAQGGCPLGTGTGSPGYRFDGEFDPAVKHDGPGKLSMANAGPGTDGSQFFLTFKATPHLNGKHTIYGEVVEGMDTLQTMEKLGSPRGRTSEPIKIEKVTIEVE